MMKQQVDVKQAAGRLCDCRAAAVFMHAHPDGDCLGSGFALAHALRSLGKEVFLLCKDPMPAMFSFMRDGFVLQGADAELPDDCLLVTVDVAVTHLLGEELDARFGSRIDLCIDHHPTNDYFAAETLLDTTAAACAEIISDVIDAMGVPMTTNIAACLYAGVSTDTGGFRNANITARSHRCVARYIDLGVDVAPLNRAFFETQSKAYLEMERLAFRNLKYYCNGRVALLAVTQKIFRQSGCNEEEYVQLVTRTRKIEGVQVGVAIRERPDGTFKISLRSHAPADVSAVATRLGGGGHVRAAAYASDLPLKETIATLIKCIEEELACAD
ncbi:MAG: bifunctional oligoribonuclease/PAP phosphatase NrnA [Oscillospiraceae bacterium]|nr:bifunctional oligoribonuclease/PAP phosphatase NrnA [Oscillospiraceae bacterium]